MNPNRPAPSLGALMVLIAVGSLGFWLVLPELREQMNRPAGTPFRLSLDGALQLAWAASVGILGGLSLMGPPLLLRESRRQRRRWGPGKFLWFVLGTASWLMWPPMIFARPRPALPTGGATRICYFYGTPLMALYVVTALFVGGRFRRSLRRRYGAGWSERFGVVTGLIWALIGVGVLISLYIQDIFQ